MDPPPILKPSDSVSTVSSVKADVPVVKSQLDIGEKPLLAPINPAQKGDLFSKAPGKKSDVSLLLQESRSKSKFHFPKTLKKKTFVDVHSDQPRTTCPFLFLQSKIF